MAFENYELNEMQFDALKEIGNIGSGHAASALSSMLDRPIDMNVPQINILDYNEVVTNLGGPENVLAGILMSLTGDVSGMIMFLIHKPFVKILLSNLLGMDIEDNFDLDEMSQSAIKEVGNIIAASYVNAIVELTGLAIEISPPELSVDMVGSILSLPAIYYANISDKIIFIKDELDKEDAASSQIILIPDVDSLKKIMESLGLGDIWVKML